MRNAMPPPLPTPARPPGGLAHASRVRARRRMIHHIIWHMQHSTHTAHAQRMHRRGVSAHTGAPGSARYINISEHIERPHAHAHALARCARERACHAYTHGCRRDFRRQLSALHTYAIIMQSFWRFSMQLRCVSNKKMFLFIILIFYRHSVFNALRPVCREMNTVLLK